MKDKVVAILGATGGIGSGLTRKLETSGARLVLLARNSDRSETLASQLSIPGGKQVLTLSVDITDPEYVEDLIKNCCPLRSNRCFG